MLGNWFGCVEPLARNGIHATSSMIYLVTWWWIAAQIILEIALITAHRWGVWYGYLFCNCSDDADQWQPVLTQVTIVCSKKPSGRGSRDGLKTTGKYAAANHRPLLVDSCIRMYGHDCCGGDPGDLQLLRRKVLRRQFQIPLPWITMDYHGLPLNWQFDNSKSHTHCNCKHSLPKWWWMSSSAIPATEFPRVYLFFYFGG